MKRKKYSPEFKREAIDLVRRSGASCRQVALEKVWLPTCSPAGFGRRSRVQRKHLLEQEELARLKRELARVTKERVFLRDAAAYFAKESSSDTR